MSQSFLTEMQAEVLHRATGGDGSAPDFHENVFTEYLMELLSGDVGIVENPVAVHFHGGVGRGTAKVNNYALADDVQEQDTLDLFTSVYRGFKEPTRVQAKDLEDAAKQATRYLNGAMGDLHAKLDPAHGRHAMTMRIHEAASTIRRARLFILTDGVSDLARGAPKKIPVGGSGLELEIQFWDLERLSRALAYGRPHEEIDIDVTTLNGSPLPCVTAAADEGEYQAFVTIVPGTLLFRIYDEHGSRLLERNVRSFLQAKGKVNRGMRDTLKVQPRRFLAYNNGISLTADSVATSRLPDGALGISRIKGLQIVNGGQTTASIHRAGKADRIDLSGVFVQTKLTVLREAVVDDLAPRIAAFANTQNPIQMADFSANDPFHIELERLSNAVWNPDQQGRWFYERARGQYFVAQANEGRTEAAARRFREKTPAHRRFTKLDAAKYLNAWDQLPHSVSAGGQKNFVQFTQRLRESKPKSWKPDERFYRELIGKAILYNNAQRLVRGGSFPDLRSQLVAYVVAALSFRTAGQLDLVYVWQNQRLSAGLEDLISAWAVRIFDGIRGSAAARGLCNYSEWCKKIDCWKAIQKLDLELPAEMPPELARVEYAQGAWGEAPTESRVALNPDNIDAQTQCRGVDAEEWIRIVRWGTDTGRLDPKQREAATELAAAAAGGWTRPLSPKRARDGRAILNLALENGALAEAPVA